MTQPQPPTRRSRVGDLLVEHGRITSDELAAALAYRQERGVKLGQALVALHLVSQQDIAWALRSQGKVHCLHLVPGIVERDIARGLPAAMARQLCAIPVHRVTGRVTVAMEDPDEEYDVEAIGLALGEPVFPVYADPTRIRECIDAVHGRETGHCGVGATPTADAGPRAAPATLGPSCSLDPLAGAPTMLESLLGAARSAGASAVYIEPRGANTEIVQRLDGARRPTSLLPRSWGAPLVERLQTLAGLDPTRGHLPQRVRTTLELQGETLEVVVASFLGTDGPHASLQFVQRAPSISLQDLGFRVEDLARLRRWCAGWGVVLVAGPTDSWREVTADALLAECVREGRFVAALGSVPTAVPGVLRAPRAAGAALVDQVQALLDQGPEVLYVDAFEDAETVRVLAQAALGGVLVVARVEAADACAAAARPAALGLRPRIAAEVLRGVIAQRAPRARCAVCQTGAQQRAADPDCAHCSGSGWRGRTIVHEILDCDSAVAGLLEEDASAARLREAAHSLGFQSLRERAAQIVQDGFTSEREIERVLST